MFLFKRSIIVIITIDLNKGNSVPISVESAGFVTFITFKILSRTVPWSFSRRTFLDMGNVMSVASKHVRVRCGRYWVVDVRENAFSAVKFKFNKLWNEPKAIQCMRVRSIKFIFWGLQINFSFHQLPHKTIPEN